MSSVIFFFSDNVVAFPFVSVFEFGWWALGLGLGGVHQKKVVFASLGFPVSLLPPSVSD